MRGFLASSIGVTCAAALALPPGPPAAATVARPAPNAEVFVPGSTQSLPLAPLGRDRALGPAAEQGLPARDVRRFSMVGVVWDDPDTALDGSVQVRTRAVTSGTWSDWQDVETHYADDGADPGTAERTSGRVRGGRHRCGWGTRTASRYACVRAATSVPPRRASCRRVCVWNSWTPGRPRLPRARR